MQDQLARWLDWTLEVLSIACIRRLLLRVLAMASVGL